MPVEAMVWPPLPDVRSVSIDHQTVAYREAGRGTTLLLLHGFLCDSRCWRHQLSDLSSKFRVVAWDAPGAGLSSDPPSTFVTADYVRFLAAFQDRLEIESAHVLGLSWGGILAQEFYRNYPQRCRSLILADTYAGWRGSLPEVVWKERLSRCLEDANGPRESVVAKFVPTVLTSDAPPNLRDEFAGIVRDHHPIGFRVMSLSSAEVDTRDLLPRIAASTLLIWGAEDRRSPLNVAEQFRAAIPNAELAVIPNAAHLSNMEQPGLFNARVRNFLAPNHSSEEERDGEQSRN